MGRRKQVIAEREEYITKLKQKLQRATVELGNQAIIVEKATRLMDPRFKPIAHKELPWDKSISLAFDLIRLANEYVCPKLIGIYLPISTTQHAQHITQHSTHILNTHNTHIHNTTHIHTLLLINLNINRHRRGVGTSTPNKRG